jgi:hypothetical protein
MQPNFCNGEPVLWIGSDAQLSCCDWKKWQLPGEDRFSSMTDASKSKHSKPSRARGLLFLALAACSVSAQAPASELSGPDLKGLIAGKRVYLSVPAGGEFPLYYRADGEVDGTGEALGLGRYLKPKDSGRWWVAGSRLCQQWRSWYDGKQFCFTVRSVGANRIAWQRDDGMSGMARIGE